jgi:pimeloyl-ACP methyl ester carboxylesterase
MWHGLARTGRDFDCIAAALADRFHIICPDTIGRGLSQWSDRPDEDYCLDAYARLACDVPDDAGLQHLQWLGTSMGGALGIRVAATTLKRRIARLVINDIGPTFPEAPYERIKAYIGNPPEFDTMGELEAYFRTIYKPFGYHTEAQWRHLAETSMRRLTLRPHHHALRPRDRAPDVRASARLRAVGVLGPDRGADAGAARCRV